MAVKCPVVRFQGKEYLFLAVWGDSRDRGSLFDIDKAHDIAVANLGFAHVGEGEVWRMRVKLGTTDEIEWTDRDVVVEFDHDAHWSRAMDFILGLGD